MLQSLPEIFSIIRKTHLFIGHRSSIVKIRQDTPFAAVFNPNYAVKKPHMYLNKRQINRNEAVEM